VTGRAPHRPVKAAVERGSIACGCERARRRACLLQRIWQRDVGENGAGVPVAALVVTT
jgi:hypothetical protein